MSFLSKITQFLFSILTRQVSAIATKDGQSLFRLIFSTVFPLFFARRLIFIFSAIFRLPYYLQIDIAFKSVYDQTDYLQFTIRSFIINTFSAIFDWRVFLLFYFSPDRRVWAHLYDLVVRNREQASFTLWHQNEVVEEPRRGRNGTNQRWRFRKYSRRVFRPRLQWTSSLRVYPQLEGRLRLSCLLICVLFELAITPTLLKPFIYFYFYQIVDHSSPQYTAVQLAYYYAVKLVILLYVVGYYLLYYLIKLITSLLCSLYAARYRALNRRLKGHLEQVDSRSSVTFSQQSSAAYRAEHVRLTAFLLRLNESTLSPVVVHYLHYILPYHALQVVRLYLQRRLYTPGEWLNEAYLMADLSLLLLVMTFFTARANDQVVRSAPTVASILARKGLRTAKKEVLSLSLHYEALWRAERELAFTVGPSGVTMNWRYLSELTFLYTVFVLFFLSKFINNEDGFKI